MFLLGDNRQKSPIKDLMHTSNRSNTNLSSGLEDPAHVLGLKKIYFWEFDRKI
jgi:hypothetical protein